MGPGDVFVLCSHFYFIPGFKFFLSQFLLQYTGHSVIVLLNLCEFVYLLQISLSLILSFLILCSDSLHRGTTVFLSLLRFVLYFNI